MARIKGAMMTRKRRNKVLKLAKGYYGSKSKLFKTAKQAVMKSGNYAYIGRKQKKRDFRRLWIARINAACRLNDISYSRFMNGLKKSGSTLNRKVLADIAVNDAAAFSALVETAKANNLNVFQYIYTLLLYMPGYKNESAGIEQLLPWSDFIQEHCSGLIDVENVTVEEHPVLIV